MGAPAPSGPVSQSRAWPACALLVLAAAWLVVGLLVLDGEATWSLAWAVAPSVALVAAAAALRG